MRGNQKKQIKKIIGLYQTRKIHNVRTMKNIVNQIKESTNPMISQIAYLQAMVKYATGEGVVEKRKHNKRKIENEKHVAETIEFLEQTVVEEKTEGKPLSTMIFKIHKVGVKDGLTYCSYYSNIE